MWWSERRRRARIAAVLAAALLTLAGCGFRPLYSGAVGGADAGLLGQIQVATIPDRGGQILRNYLLDRLNPRGQPDVPRYRLETVVNERLQKLAFTTEDTATRANLQMTARYTLRDLQNNAIVFKNVSRIVASYNILRSTFATQSAESDARRRGSRELADDMKLKLAAFLGKT
jgi:LPS-assembly lipoprotein